MKFRPLYLLLAAVAAVPAAVLLFGGSPKPTTGPEEIQYGHEACARCHMHFATPGFAGERRGRDGRLVKYDDLACLLQAIASAHEETTEAWVEDHDRGGWVPLASAVFVRGGMIHTPMGSGLVAFKNRGAADRLALAAIASITPLEELLRDRSLLEPGAAHAQTAAAHAQTAAAHAQTAAAHAEEARQ